jgi:hypothetical protein
LGSSWESVGRLHAKLVVGAFGLDDTRRNVSGERPVGRELPLDPRTTHAHIA